jgi:aspartyl-tRNA(Asn)/glutamyl-tRNA(Gln) amidotransferase subunit C
MMNIQKQEIKYLARLARIDIDDKTIDEVSPRIRSVLELIDQLQDADTSGIEAVSHPMQGSQRLRKDEVSEINNRERFQEIAPDMDDGLFLVPRVIE